MCHDFQSAILTDQASESNPPSTSHAELENA